MTDVATLGIKVDSKGVKQGTRNLGELDRQASKTEKSAARMGKAIGAAVGFLATGALARAAIANTVEQERVVAQLEATLRSTGGAAGLTKDELLNMASAMQEVTTFGDETVIASQSLLLTFTKIGKEAFPRAQKAILDVATAMGTDLNSATLQVGKALNDPVLGMTALSRSGIQFTEDQKEVVKQMVATGRSADAQALILAELETQFGGSAEAARNTLGGALKSLQNAFGDLLEGDSGGAGVNDTTAAINDLTKTLSDPQIKAAFAAITSGILGILSAVSRTLPEIISFTRWIGEDLAAAMHGAALDDVVRMEDELEGLNRQFGDLETVKLSPDWINSITGVNDDIIAARDRARQLKQAIDEYYNKPPAPGPAAEIKDELEAVAPVLDQVKTKTDAVTKSTKTLTDTIGPQIAQLRFQAETVAMTSDAVTLLRLANEGATASQLAQAAASLQVIAGYEAEQDAIEALADAERERTAELDRRKAEFGQDPSGAIIGDVQPITGGRFDDQQARYDAEREAEAERYAQQQERLQEALELQLITRQEYANLEVEMMATTAARVAQIEMARNDMMLESMGSAFGQMSSDLMSFANTFGEEQKGMFEIAKAAAIAQTVIQTYQGAQQAFTSLSAIPIVGPALGTAAAAAAIAGGLARVSSISSQQPSFDGGGFTGYGPRTGGLDGKGGFMAMMHPQETVTDHSKGQSLPSGGGGISNTFILQGKQDIRTQQQMALKASGAQQRVNARFGK